MEVDLLRVFNILSMERENTIIDTLELEVLALNNVANNYYTKYFKFIKVLNKENRDVVYMPESVSLFIEKAGLKYPWSNYRNGFFHQYNKGIVCQPEALLFNITKNIRPDFLFPVISFGKEQNQYFNEEKAFEYGRYIAQIYCAWELIIRNWPNYNEIFQIEEVKNGNNGSRTKKVIFETITNIDKQGWQYAFVSETDYNLFTDLLTNFFEYKPYTLPETIIQLKRTCKTKVARALGEIHKELSNENKLSTDTKYFQLIRVLSHFEKEKEGDLYKALTR